MALAPVVAPGAPVPATAGSSSPTITIREARVDCLLVDLECVMRRVFRKLASSPLGAQAAGAQAAGPDAVRSSARSTPSGELELVSATGVAALVVSAIKLQQKTTGQTKVIAAFDNVVGLPFATTTRVRTTTRDDVEAVTRAFVATRADVTRLVIDANAPMLHVHALPAILDSVVLGWQLRRVVTTVLRAKLPAVAVMDGISVASAVTLERIYKEHVSTALLMDLTPAEEAALVAEVVCREHRVCGSVGLGPESTGEALVKLMAMVDANNNAGGVGLVSDHPDATLAALLAMEAGVPFLWVARDCGTPEATDMRALRRSLKPHVRSAVFLQLASSPPGVAGRQWQQGVPEFMPDRGEVRVDRVACVQYFMSRELELAAGPAAPRLSLRASDDQVLATARAQGREDPPSARVWYARTLRAELMMMYYAAATRLDADKMRSTVLAQFKKRAKWGWTTEAAVPAPQRPSLVATDGTFRKEHYWLYERIVPTDEVAIKERDARAFDLY